MIVKVPGVRVVPEVPAAFALYALIITIISIIIHVPSLGYVISFPPIRVLRSAYLSQPSSYILGCAIVLRGEESRRHPNEPLPRIA